MKMEKENPDIVLTQLLSLLSAMAVSEGEMKRVLENFSKIVEMFKIKSGLS